MTHEYPRGIRGPAAQDVVLVAAWVVVFALEDGWGSLRWSLLGAIPIALAWGAVTLHFPSRVEIDDDGVVFGRYGRRHRFAWSQVRCVSVRKFLVGDRVLVRIEPSGGAWRGRYWLLEGMAGFESVVRELERRGRAQSS